MTDTDDHSERLRAQFRAAEPTKPASGAARAERKDPVVDADVDQRFAERLLAQGDRKLQETDRKDDQ